MKKKISSQRGETILETLIALLIIVVSISMLTTTIVRSASILKQSRDEAEEGFSYGKDSTVPASVTLSGENISLGTRSVNVYKTEQHGVTYYYYEPIVTEG